MTQLKSRLPTLLHEPFLTVADICDGFVYNELEAKAVGVSNCPLCAVGHDANARRIYDFKEMEADHVTAWSKGGDTSEANCQMLCKTHNRAKGNA